MSDDPLARFRQRVTGSAPPTTSVSSASLVVNRAGPDAYAAFAAKDKVTRLDIRCASGLAHAVAYNYLLNISYNRKTYEEFFLTVSGLTIMVKGRALRPVIDAIKLGSCEFIQEYDAAEFSTLPASGDPIIDSIQVEVMSSTASRAA
ncbi:hypothetical protein LJR039_007569 [Pseudorhodoferax sp. LjRoot39]|uniref:hypothetical protein n=1 Tax=Pseudorhodoferax sp. LjRoot39 TaxID=3342328 RepID=UPI003ECDF404